MSRLQPGISDRRLRYFFEVVTVGSVRGAADVFDVEPSVVSRQIQLLERELGCKLLEKRGRNVFPTEAAALVMEHCRDRWASEEALKVRLLELSRSQRGEIRVIAGEGFMESLNQALSEGFYQKYPNINIVLEQVSSYDVVRKVMNDEAHIGIAYCAPNEPAISVLKSRRLPVGLVTWPDHPLALANKALTLEDVLPYPVALMQEQFAVRKIVKKAESVAGIEFSPKFTTNSLTTLKNHAKARRAITFMSEYAVSSETRTGELVALRIDNAVLNSAQVQLIVRENRTASEAMLELQEQFANMPLFNVE